MHLCERCLPEVVVGEGSAPVRRGRNVHSLPSFMVAGTRCSHRVSLAACASAFPEIQQILLSRAAQSAVEGDEVALRVGSCHQSIGSIGLQVG